MLAHSSHTKKPSHTRLGRAISSIWIHSRAEQFENPVPEEEIKEKGPLYLLTAQRNTSQEALEHIRPEQREEVLIEMRAKHQVTELLPVSIFTKYTPAYSEETKKTYANEHSYYASPPGKAFLGSI